MQAIFGAASIVLLVAMVVIRASMLKKRGIDALQFGKIDRKDFLLPPFALFYFYLIFARAFHWPTPAHRELFHNGAAAWCGVALCLAGLALLLWSLISFRNSFRVGIDTKKPDSLVTSGAFAFSRNPIYAAFMTVLAGQFLIFPHWIMLVYLAGAVLVIHRQVLREEDFLMSHYGQDYRDYRRRVRRYL